MYTPEFYIKIIKLFLKKNIKIYVLTDDINTTIDYTLIYKIIKTIFFKKKYNLIENLAYDIAKSLTETYNLIACKVAVRKPNVPIQGVLDNVEVEITFYGE